MKGIVLAALCGLLAAPWVVSPLAADEGKAEEKTFEGRLIDLSCYTMGMMGDKHASCALKCAQKGLPVGLLEEKTKKVYTVVLPSPGLGSYVERMVRFTGKVHVESLLVPTRMDVLDGEAWKTVELPKAM